MIVRVPPQLADSFHRRGIPVYYESLNDHEWVLMINNPLTQVGLYVHIPWGVDDHNLPKLMRVFYGS